MGVVARAVHLAREKKERKKVDRHGGLTFIRHNELRDLTAGWLQEVCYNVAVEPPLSPLNGETIAPVSAIRSDEARVQMFVRRDFGVDARVHFLIIIIIIIIGGTGKEAKPVKT